jgi:hypothetical protein
MRSPRVSHLTFRRTVMGAAALCMGFVLALPAGAQLSIPNGNFDDGFINGEGDTLPNVWGDRVRATGCSADGTCLYWDGVDFTEGIASGRIEGVVDGGIILVNTVSGVERHEGEDIIIRGKYKTDIPATASGRLGIAAVPSCKGGDYKQISYHHMVRESYSTNGEWIEFEYVETVPTTQYCEDTYSLRSAAVDIHVYFNSEGTVWLDDFTVESAVGVRAVTFSSAHEAGRQRIRLGTHAVTFAQPTDYSVAILRPNGQIHSVHRGTGMSADLFSGPVPAGTYIVKVSSGLGSAARTVIVGQ